MKVNLIGYKPYDFTDDKGHNYKGFNLFFSVPNMVGIEGKGCMVQKVSYNSELKKYSYDFDVNTLSVGAEYDFIYENTLDKDMKPVQRLTKIVRVTK